MLTEGSRRAFGRVLNVIGPAQDLDMSVTVRATIQIRIYNLNHCTTPAFTVSQVTEKYGLDSYLQISLNSCSTHVVALSRYNKTLRVKMTSYEH